MEAFTSGLLLDIFLVAAIWNMSAITTDIPNRIDGKGCHCPVGCLAEVLEGWIFDGSLWLRVRQITRISDLLVFQVGWSGHGQREVVAGLGCWGGELGSRGL